MNCMKCGVEIAEHQVFCDHCLEVMEKYPVKPETHVHLPRRSLSQESSKKAAKRKRAPSHEEMISALRLKVLRLRLVMVILVFVICLLSGFLGMNLYQQYSKPNTGRNYSVDTTMGQ